MECQTRGYICVYYVVGHAAFYLDHQYTVILYPYHVKSQITLLDVNWTSQYSVDNNGVDTKGHTRCSGVAENVHNLQVSLLFLKLTAINHHCPCSCLVEGLIAVNPSQPTLKLGSPHRSWLCSPQYIPCGARLGLEHLEPGFERPKCYDYPQKRDAARESLHMPSLVFHCFSWMRCTTINHNTPPLHERHDYPTT